jgi:hypothetical protein
VDRLTRRAFLVALGLLAAVGLVAMLASSGSPWVRPDEQSVEGVVVAVDTAGLGAVNGFTLRTSDGQELEFGLSGLRNGVAFPPGHLAEHVATSQPIRVWYRESAAGLEALWLEDAPPG